MKSIWVLGSLADGLYVWMELQNMSDVSAFAMFVACGNSCHRKRLKP